MDNKIQDLSKGYSCWKKTSEHYMLAIWASALDSEEDWAYTQADLSLQHCWLCQEDQLNKVQDIEK